MNIISRCLMRRAVFARLAMHVLLSIRIRKSPKNEPISRSFYRPGYDHTAFSSPDAHHPPRRQPGSHYRWNFRSLHSLAFLHHHLPQNCQRRNQKHLEMRKCSSQIPFFMRCIYGGNHNLPVAHQAQETVGRSLIPRSAKIVQPSFEINASVCERQR